jgi:hypothetical protein
VVTTTQILRGTSVTLTETFEVDGAPINLGSGVPVVTALYPDGSALDPAPVATHVEPAISNVGKYQITLDAEAEVTILDPITWVGTIGGEPQTLRSRVEWLGAQLFTISELRDYAMPGSGTKLFTDPAKYPDTRLHQARAATLSRFATALGVSPVPRHAREVHSLGPGGQLIVRELAARTLLSVTLAGVTQATSGYHLTPAGVVLPVTGYTLGAWGSHGIAVAVVEYEHGRDGVDDDGRDAALQYAAAKLAPSAFTSGTSYTTPDGVTVAYEPSEVGRGGFVRFTGLREVDRYLNLHATASIAVA